MSQNRKHKNFERNERGQRENTKLMLIKEFKTKNYSGEKTDVSKIVDDYQTRFQVPKFIIIRQLNLKKEKSLFTKFQEQSEVSSKANLRENHAYLNDTTKLLNLDSGKGKYKGFLLFDLLIQAILQS